jgi:hypothetical protein
MLTPEELQLLNYTLTLCYNLGRQVPPVFEALSY